MERSEKPLFERKTPDTNVFRDLGIVWDERADSMFLAWLFNPRATHGQGDLFLSRLLRLCGLSDCFDARDDHTCAVFTEFRGSEARVDIVILVTCKFIIYIENKLKSREGPEQTQREYRDLQQQAEARGIPEEFRRAIYLTPLGTKPEGDPEGNWVALSDVELANSFRDILDSVTDLRTRILLEDWISICDGRLTDMEFSDCALAVIQHWDGAWDVVSAVNQFDFELTQLRVQIAEDLKKQDWWTYGWSVVSDKPGQLYIGHSSWKVGSKPAIWIGLDSFFSDCVLGPSEPAGLYVWVAGQTELVDVLTRAIREHDKQMIGQFDGKKNNVVRQLLPVCTQGNSTTYLRDVRDSTLAFVGHYAEFFRRKEIDPLIRSAVRKAKTKK